MVKHKKVIGGSLVALVAFALLFASATLSTNSALAESGAQSTSTVSITVSATGASNGASATIEKAAYNTGETAVLKWTGGQDGNDFVVPESISFNGKTYNVADLMPIASLQNANTEYKRRMNSDGTMTTFESMQNYLATTHTLSLGEVTVGGTVTVTFSKVAPVYRLYNMITSEHLFTTQKAEYDKFVELCKTDADAWIGEGISWLAPKEGTGTAQVYRLYNSGLGSLGHSSHYYTSDETEKTSLISQYGWADDGTINGFLSGGTTAIYTCYNEALGSAHHYTSSKSEWQGLDQHGWALEEDKNGTNPVKTPEGVFQCSLATQWSFDGNYYTVRHILGTDTANAETQYVSGRSGATTTAAAKTIPGYTAGEITQKTIAADNSTVVDVTYQKNTYTITYDVKGHGTAPENTVAEYGAAITKPTDPTYDNVQFLGWYYDSGCTDGNEVSWTTMPATNMTVYAKWADTIADYTIEFFEMNTDGTYPDTTTDNTTASGTIGEQTDYAAHTTDREGFYVDTEQTSNAEIVAGGTTVVKVYFARNKVTISYVSDAKTEESGTDGTEHTLKTETVLVGNTLTKPTETYTAYGREFESWLKSGFYNEDAEYTLWDFEKEIVPLTQANGSEIKIYAKWKGVDAWISRAKYITTGNTTETANKKNELYKGSPEAEVVRSGEKIKADVAILRDSTKKDTEEYKAVVDAYTNYMKNDDYHLYVRWDYATTDATNKEQEPNKYLEFRVINVGEHYNVDITTNAEGTDTTQTKKSDGSVLTFQMTHLTPSAYFISNKPEEERTGTEGWKNSPLRNERIAQLASSYANLLGGLVTEVEKHTFEGGSSTSSKQDTTEDKFFLASVYETVAGLGKTSPYEGETYGWYNNLNITVTPGQTQTNPALVRTTRAGNAPLGDTSDGSYWTRTPNRSDTIDQVAISKTGYCIDGTLKLNTLKQDVRAGISICFAF